MLQRGFKVSPGFATQVAVSPTYVSNILQKHGHNDFDNVQYKCDVRNRFYAISG